MKNTTEKADNIIVLQMVFAATENQKGVSVIADYTDMLLFCASLFGSETDNLFNINNNYFAQMVHKIHPAELQLNNKILLIPKHLFKTFIYRCNCIVSTKIFDKHYCFDMENFPFLCRISLSVPLKVYLYEAIM